MNFPGNGCFIYKITGNKATQQDIMNKYKYQISNTTIQGIWVCEACKKGKIDFILTGKWKLIDRSTEPTILCAVCEGIENRASAKKRALDQYIRHLTSVLTRPQLLSALPRYFFALSCVLPTFELTPTDWCSPSQAHFFCSDGSP
jgi:hypothetical protein